MLKITSYLLGPFYTNTYLVADPESGDAVVIDPADAALEPIAAEIKEHAWNVRQVWITHAHFDHTAGIEALFQILGVSVPVALHLDDLHLWRSGGDGALFGMPARHDFDPEISLQHGDIIKVGGAAFEVRHVPGHAPGHVLFYCAEEEVCFCGDLIFRQSIGRTDLQGGDYDALMRSIRTQVLVLPPQVRLLPGHGEETTVAVEIKYNPFLQ